MRLFSLVTPTVIAFAGAMAFPAEMPDLRFVLAAGVVMGGVLVPLYRPGQ